MKINKDYLIYYLILGEILKLKFVLKFGNIFSLKKRYKYHSKILNFYDIKLISRK